MVPRPLRVMRAWGWTSPQPPRRATFCAKWPSSAAVAAGRPKASFNRAQLTIAVLHHSPAPQSSAPSIAKRPKDTHSAAPCRGRPFAVTVATAASRSSTPGSPGRSAWHAVARGGGTAPPGEATRIAARTGVLRHAGSWRRAGRTTTAALLPMQSLARPRTRARRHRSHPKKSPEVMAPVSNL